MNEFINKRAAGIMKMQQSVILVKKNLKISIWKIKNTIKLEIIVFIQGSIELLHTAYVIDNTIYLKKSL